MASQRMLQELLDKCGDTAYRQNAYAFYSGFLGGIVRSVTWDNESEREYAMRALESCLKLMEKGS